MSRNLYEYIAFEHKPSKDEVLKAVNNEIRWEAFISSQHQIGLVARDIAETMDSDWELYEDDDHVYLVIRRYQSEEWEITKVSVRYIRKFDDEQIDLDDLD
ncbi:hypothetical protein IFE17_02785 [Actinobacillus sp. GY-402]|nr:hypothetical protein IFE17_02785 [Actinobacillus sp. GY-402]